MNRHNYDLEKFSLEVFSNALKEFMDGKPVSNVEKEEYISPYKQLSREEVLALKDGDECYIQSSYGMQKCIYPYLNSDTHRNLFGKGGSNKSIEEKRDYGPIYKKI